jgi:anti-sigma regulatory factor (Ser/Thr protein kinase)
VKARFGEQIKKFILENVEDNPSDISRITSEKFQVSRNAVAKHLRTLIKEGLLRAEGKTKDRKYDLVSYVDETFTFTVNEQLEEHIVWRDTVSPLLKDLPKNIFDICSYGITEMVNNVIDHSGSLTMGVSVERDFQWVRLAVLDEGIGIFQKIQNDFQLDDPRQALLELTKGKLTSDRTKHSGEGIFFTSRMFQKFCISSGGLYFDKYKEGDEWFLETKVQRPVKGTRVMMDIKNTATHTMEETFAAYTSEYYEYGFSKTQVPLELLQYEGEALISRSQAKRLMSRVESFKEVILDFKGINAVGRAFVDEIFRVWARNNPETKIMVVNSSEEIQKMIDAIKNDAGFSAANVAGLLYKEKIDE